MDARDPPPSSPRPPDGDGDGVRITVHPRRRGWRVVGLVAVAALAAFVGYRMLATRAGPARAATGASTGQPSAERNAAPESSRASATGRAPTASGSANAGAGMAVRDGEDPTPDLSDYVLPGEAPSMAQVIDGLHRRGIRTGLGAFQPPGTSPPLLGLEVPEDFPLPEGYVRHYQATDDGQRIAPILMFSPDLQLFDARGRPVSMPADRVVPPALAPPGLPLRQVRIPPPRNGSAGP